MGVFEDWNPVFSLQEERRDLGDELGLLELGSPFEGSWLSGQIREKRGRLGKHGTKTPLFGGCNGILKGWLLGLKFQAFLSHGRPRLQVANPSLQKAQIGKPEPANYL